MKLKYYMRTLGIAIIVTALLMGLATVPKSQAQSNALGDATALDGAVLTDVADTQTEETEGIQETEAPETEELVAATEEDETEEILAETEEMNSSEEEQTEETEEQTQESVPVSYVESTGESISFVIAKGDSSDKVSRRLQELGLVEDAKAFDKYLCANGYDKRISVGTYEIPAGSLESDIAKIIAGK